MLSGVHCWRNSHPASHRVQGIFNLAFWKMNLTHSALITSLYRDGILFYFAVLPFSLLNALAVFYLPPPWKTHLFDTPLRVMHTILTCRLILRICHSAEHEEEGSLENISALEFANPSTTDHTTQV
ncbi:hypothetical protein D9758_016390 [Tetrapyrgos nigripes]|uniref:Uncharacterized protein n=1 Tax=Tetrapyrgos nigripes TaxID=182062 RepID=A0A8H5C7V0_9AGAR|nr:hypothetical protein D9758_016390 [Tetrapyrgos nigripes]